MAPIHMSAPTVLLYTSSAAQVPTREGVPLASGTWLSEITEPLRPLYEAGAQFRFATPNGQPCVIDARSRQLRYHGFSTARRERELKFLNTLRAAGLDAPQPISELVANSTALDQLDAVFIPGGHAPMTDVLYKDWLAGETYNPHTGALLQHFHATGKPTGSICHGPAALAAASAAGEWPYRGYRLTCVSPLGEWLSEDAPLLGTGYHLPTYPKDLLLQLGARVENVLVPRQLVIEDRELITGQDPLSGRRLGERFARTVWAWWREHRTTPAAADTPSYS